MTSKTIEVLKTLKTAPLNETYFYNGTTYYTEDYVVTLITEKDQELQKAREEAITEFASNLRVLIERGNAETAMNFIKDHSELDQDNSKT